MSVVFRGPVVKCWSQKAAHHPTVVSSKPTSNVSTFTDRGKKCDV